MMQSITTEWVRWQTIVNYRPDSFVRDAVDPDGPMRWQPGDQLYVPVGSSTRWMRFTIAHATNPPTRHWVVFWGGVLRDYVASSGSFVYVGHGLTPREYEWIEAYLYESSRLAPSALPAAFRLDDFHAWLQSRTPADLTRRLVERRALAQVRERYAVYVEGGLPETLLSRAAFGTE